MAIIREDVVASAAKFLQDPSVAASPVGNRIAFLTAKNLTPDEVQAALSRAGSGVGPLSPSPSSAVGPVRSYNGHYEPQQQYPPQWTWEQHQQQAQYHHHQPPPPPQPRRDWRDYFIVATVVGGVSYGLYQLGKRYVYPLIAPPTPDRLETDKKSIDDQFERAFTLVAQLSKDTDALKEAEQQRTERLDTALSELETVMDDIKAANRRREDDAQRMRDDVQALKDSLPRALDSQKDMADSRLREVNAELRSLKTLISQRMAPSAPSTSINSYLHTAPGTGTGTGTTAGVGAIASTGTGASTGAVINGSPTTIGGLYGAKQPGGIGAGTPPTAGGISSMMNNSNNNNSASNSPASDAKGKAGAGADEPSGISIGLQKRHTIAMGGMGGGAGDRKSPFSSSLTQPMSIPAWQIAPKSSASTAAPDGATAGTANEAGNATS